MIALIVGGIICLCSTFCGICINGYYKKRLSFEQDFLNFIEFSIQNIKFSKEGTNKIIVDFLKQSYEIDCDNSEIKKRNSPFALQLIRLRSELLSDKQCSREVFENLCQNKILDKRQIYISIEIFSKFGVLDYVNQIKHLEKAQSMLLKEIENATKKVNTNGKLAYKLGFLLGIALMILMV